MDFIPLTGALAALLAALAAVRITARWTPLPAAGRCETIDGLRGFLAFAVFLHHAAITERFLAHGTWTAPRSHLFVNFGQASVALFFMITGFLFYGALVRHRGGSLDWLRLFCSRILRLTPLYLFAMALMFVIVAVQTGWTWRQPPAEVLAGAGQWLGFTAFGTPDLNGLARTYVITAGVTWSLPYEWAFYLCLPLLALVQRVRVPLAWLAGSAAVAAAIGPDALRWPHTHYIAAFAGGIVAVHVAALPAMRAFAARPAASVLLLVAGAWAYAGFPSAWQPASLALLGVVFTLVAAGCDLFGVLRAKTARVFGEYAYSIYLLHGIALYVAFTLVPGAGQAAQLSPAAYWCAVAALAPLLVIACSLTFRYVEAPMMGRTAALVAAIRRQPKVAPVAP
ncbi:acyltransferase family protein [Pseudoduganella lutea]|uniref:Acyltransferase n=1 Tax=Pseudoduganella lutea TaxID=321985 RepID=A0A4P6KT44_9BURK|nr:acyltransferase [Pseudoduganella lutea]QBE62289.1 acyltransferase [Pseudoduganella lutea]